MAVACIQGRNDCPDDWPRMQPPVSGETLKNILEEYVAVFGRDKLVTPDDLRGGYTSLLAALEQKGPAAFWPDVESIRGKFLIVTGDVRLQLYGVAPWSALLMSVPVMFTQGSPGRRSPELLVLFYSVRPAVTTSLGHCSALDHEAQRPGMRALR